jgi:two-component system nitrogen regulation response regulator GlnG
MPRLLVVDDEPNLLFSLQDSLASNQLEVVTATTAREALSLLSRARPDAAILDVRLPDISGLEAFEKIKQIDPRLPVIIITAHPAMEIAIEAMKLGAFDYLVKPCDFHQLRDLVHRAIDQGRITHVRAVYGDDREDDPNVDRIVGNSPLMQEVYKAIGRIAAQDVSTIILGESGTGKELVARAIYNHSHRTDKPFLAINCAALPESILESELFGHERGAFTGAERRRIGKFEQANGGTIFLDEVGDMSLATQAKMLRLLQDGEFQRVGGNETLHTDVRVLAATNRDLEALVAEGRFRHDLFYRLADYTIQLPPLRERLEDLPALIQHYIKIFNRDLGKHITTYSPETLEIFRAHSWRGNIRELQAAIRHAMLHATSETLVPHCLPRYLRDQLNGNNGAGALDDSDLALVVRKLLRSGESEIYEKVVRHVDRIVLREVLDHVEGSQVEASELLGISRNTLRSKLRALDLAIAKQVISENDQGAQ